MAKRISSTKERLSEMMDYFHITQTDISKKTGIPKPSISHYCNGKRVPVQDQLSILCDPYGINPAWLMGYDVPMWLKDTPQSFDTSEDFESAWQRAGGEPHPIYRVDYDKNGPKHTLILSPDEYELIIEIRNTKINDEHFYKRMKAYIKSMGEIDNHD